MTCLHVCPSCTRHVRSTETTCPFCDAVLPEDFGVCGEPRAKGRPLTRAAFVLMSATALTACGKTAGPSNAGPGVDVHPDAGANMQNQMDASVREMPLTVYGPPPTSDAGAVPIPKPVPQKK